MGKDGVLIMEDKNLIWEVIHGQSVSKSNHYMVGSGGGRKWIVKDSFIREYEESFKRQCKIYKDKMIDTPFILYVRFYSRSMANDLDNVLKSLLDNLQYCHCITNDNLCLKIEAEKHLTNKPRVEFAIKPFNEQKNLF